MWSHKFLYSCYMERSQETPLQEQENRIRDSFYDRIYHDVKAQLTETEQQAFERFVNQLLQDQPHPLQLISETHHMGAYRMKEHRMRQVQEKAYASSSEAQKINCCRAKILEGILYHLLGKRRLWGDEYTIHPTSEYDDWINGADLVINSTTHPKPLAMIDITLGFDKYILDQKIERILDGIKHGELGTLDYSLNPVTNTLAEHHDVPRIVLGIADEKLFDDLIQLSLENKLTKLMTHPALFVFTHELQIQTQWLQKYAKKYGAADHRGSDRLVRRKQILEKYATFQQTAETLFARFVGQLALELKQKFPDAGNEALEKARDIEMRKLERTAGHDRLYQNMTATFESLSL